VADTSIVMPGSNRGGSPFDQIRRLDEYGREYWAGRELQPLMVYGRWHEFAAVIAKAKASLALVHGDDQAEHHFVIQHSDGGRWGNQSLDDYRLTRFAAYLTAMAGDDTKEAVAQARVYFAVRAREAELGALTQAEIRDTALARAREMVDYRIFRDMMAANAPDYEPGSKGTGKFFGAMQNRLYRHLTGMDAEQIKQARDICHWPDRETGKDEPGPKSPHRKVAKNYLTCDELKKLDRLVARLCLRAQDIAEDGIHLTTWQWVYLVDQELALLARPIAA
jgi:hypothetical protein